MKYLSYIRRHPACFLLGPFFMVLEAAGEIWIPILCARMIDEGAASRSRGLIALYGGQMALLALAMLICGVAGAYFAIRGAATLTSHIRCEVFRKIQGFSFEELDAFSSGALITRITNDISQIQSFFQMLLRGFFRTPVMIIGAITTSLVLNRSLAMVLYVAVAFLVGAIAFLIRLATPRYGRMQGQLDEMNETLEEEISGIKVIKGFVREEEEKARFRGVNEALRKKTISALSAVAVLMPVSALAMNAATVLIVWRAGRQIMVGGMQVGVLTAFLTYLTQTLNGLNFLANIFLQGSRAAASDRRIQEIYDTQVSLTDEGAACREHGIASGDVTFERVDFAYRKGGRKVLEDVSFSIRSGELVGIVGSTGSGKTTLVSLIPRLRDPLSGRVLVDGVDVRDLSLRELRSAVGVVLQKNTLFSGTVEENLRWGRAEATAEEMEAALKISCAWDFVMEREGGLSSVVEHEGANLSGGQRQRLCIARALLARPKILILDDSTSAVDMATDAKIRQALRRELPGMTKIIIAQRIHSVQDADQVIVLDEGRIEAVGTHQELLGRSRIYRQIYDSQKKEA